MERGLALLHSPVDDTHVLALKDSDRTKGCLYDRSTQQLERLLEQTIARKSWPLTVLPPPSLTPQPRCCCLLAFSPDAQRTNSMVAVKRYSVGKHRDALPRAALRSVKHITRHAHLAGRHTHMPTYPCNTPQREWINVGGTSFSVATPIVDTRNSKHASPISPTRCHLILLCERRREHPIVIIIITALPLPRVAPTPATQTLQLTLCRVVGCSDIQSRQAKASGSSGSATAGVGGGGGMPSGSAPPRPGGRVRSGPRPPPPKGAKMMGRGQRPMKPKQKPKPKPKKRPVRSPSCPMARPCFGLTNLLSACMPCPCFV